MRDSSSEPVIKRRRKRRKAVTVKTIYSVAELAEMAGHTADYVRSLLKRCGVFLDKGNGRYHKVYLHMLLLKAKPFWDSCVARERLRVSIYGAEGEPEVDDEDPEDLAD